VSLATTPAYVGSMITSAEELDALPVLAVLMADPDGVEPREHERRMVLQKRADFDTEPWWHAARRTTKDDLPKSEADGAVHGTHYGPFLVIWLPPAPPVEQAEAAA
jgi:hypothetical protein